MGQIPQYIIDAVLKEFHFMVGGKTNVDAKELFELREKVKSRTSIYKEDEDLSSNELVWKCLYFNLDKEFKKIFDPGQKEKIDKDVIKRDVLIQLKDIIGEYNFNRKTELWDWFFLRSYSKKKAGYGNNPEELEWLEHFKGYDSQFLEEFIKASPAEKDILCSRSNHEELLEFMRTHKFVLDWRDARVAKVFLIIFTLYSGLIGFILSLSTGMIILCCFLGFIVAAIILSTFAQNAYVLSVTGRFLKWLSGL
jgi:hypothetical protein